ncbi:MAG: DNA topoisomerase 3 [Clostridia bacterium]|nr:DNA topoisomerase 3 [Clostridia bacterium]
MRKLIIAEKPSVGRDIARVLGATQKGDGYLYNDSYIVSWAFGHLVTLCEPGEVDERYTKWRMQDLPMLPETIPLKVIPSGKKQFDVLKMMLNSPKIDSVICATDSAREGELIFRYIYQMSGSTKPVERLWISSMTDAAIKAGFAALKPSSAYDALYDSAKCRSLADWLVGMNASRAFTLRYNVRLSVGRVQTPTLNLIVRRDREIEAFVPEDYWTLKASFGDYEGFWFDPSKEKDEPESSQEKTAARRDTRIADKATADRIKKEVLKQLGTIIESTTKRNHTPPPQLFDLTSLQREANSKLGFSAEKTLNTAQELYEKHKLITYPRTDSRYLSDDLRPKVKRILEQLPQPYADFVRMPGVKTELFSKRYYDNTKISDHHAIIPTEKRTDINNLPEPAKSLYDMIVRRFIAVHCPDYEYDSAKIITQVGEHHFRSTGSMPVNEGWKALYANDKNASKEKEAPLPPLKKGDTRTVQGVTVKAEKTKPPKPHNDASLLNLMENAGRDIEDESLREQMKDSGLGTPATRAATIERLIDVGYARRAGKTIVSTQKGRNLIDVVPEEISSAATTGKWERALAKMAGYSEDAERTVRVDKFLGSIGRFATFLVSAAQTGTANVQFEPEAYNAKKKRTKAK